LGARRNDPAIKAKAVRAKADRVAKGNRGKLASQIRSPEARPVTASVPGGGILIAIYAHQRPEPGYVADPIVMGLRLTR
jgi:hypothetical protein